MVPVAERERELQKLPIVRPREHREDWGTLFDTPRRLGLGEEHGPRW